MSSELARKVRAIYQGGDLFPPGCEDPREVSENPRSFSRKLISGHPALVATWVRVILGLKVTLKHVRYMGMKVFSDGYLEVYSGSPKVYCSRIGRFVYSVTSGEYPFMHVIHQYVLLPAAICKDNWMDRDRYMFRSVKLNKTQFEDADGCKPKTD